MPLHPYQRFYDIIRKIPRGRVATYGQIARLAGLPAHARQVGYALSAYAKEDLPWHRVINAKGDISPRGTPDVMERQKARLEKERVLLGEQGRINLARFQWKKGASV